MEPVSHHASHTTYTMTSRSVNELIRETLKNIYTTTTMVKENEVEMEKLKGEYENMIRYTNTFSYSDGFWDGFLYGACLMTCIMGGMIYFLR